MWSQKFGLHYMLSSWFWEIRTHSFQILLGCLQERLARGDPLSCQTHVQPQSLLLHPITHLLPGPACKWRIQLAGKHKLEHLTRLMEIFAIWLHVLLKCHSDNKINEFLMRNWTNESITSSTSYMHVSLLSGRLYQQQIFPFWESTLSCVAVNTDLLVFCRSRDQPSLGPAVALTPPRLNSLSDRLSSRLNVVDWLLLSLQRRGESHFYHVHLKLRWVN